MNKTLLFLVIILLIGFSCSGGKKEKGSAVTAVSSNGRQNVVIPLDSGVIRINLTNGKGSVRTQKKETQTIYIEFLSTGYKKVSAHLSSPDPYANIRFSQIFLPYGTMDGPWGRDIEYELPVDGLYKLSVNENRMAGPPWCGIFDVQVRLMK